MNAIVVLLDFGLVVKDDSDIAETDADQTISADDSIDKEIKSLISLTQQKAAATWIIATKAYWWLQNHHIGQGDIVGYAKKAATVVY